MGQTFNRRHWIRQTALAMGAISIAPSINARPDHYSPNDPFIRLNANENPYGPSVLARKAMADAVNLSNRYPFESTNELREKIGARYGLTKENVLMGAGSSEILGLVAQLAALRKGNAVTADPTFGLWFNLAQRAGLTLTKVPLTADKKHDLQRMKEKINDETRMVYICNPNNPTGTILPAADIKNFIDSIEEHSLVLLDEAYIEYTEEPTLALLVKDNPRLIIAKTFSKIYGMAGARIGYALAHPSLISQMNDLQPWANAGTSIVSVRGAIASLDDEAFVRTSKIKNSEVKKNTLDAFARLGIRHTESHSNFLYYSLENQKSDFLANLGKNNIRGGRINEENGKWTRITIGTKEDMNRFIEVLKQSF